MTLAVGHLGHLVRAYVGDGRQWGLEWVDHASETSPLGTIGPLLTMRDRLPETFLVMNGDVLTNLDFAELLRHHRSSGSWLTISTCWRKVEIDFGVLGTCDGNVVEFSEKPTLNYRVSMGVNAMSSALLTRYEPGIAMGFDELVLDLIRDGLYPREYPFEGCWLDIGRPDDYDRANAEFDVLASVLFNGAQK